MTVDEWFAQVFWPAYPHKKRKPAVLKAVKALKPGLDKRRAIMAGLEKWKRSDDWTKNGGMYIVSPLNFINDEVWNDEPRQLTLPAGKGYDVQSLRLPTRD